MGSNSKHEPIKNKTKNNSKTYHMHSNLKNLVVKPKKESYKDGLLAIDDAEEKYDKLFEKKLASQYNEFQLIKEHHLQIKKFVRIFAVLITIILLALLLLSFTS